MNMQGIFDITSLKQGSRIAIIGKRGCGNTTLAKDIIETFRQKKHRSVVLCNDPDQYSDTVGYENCSTGNPVGVIQSLKKLPNNERILFVSDEYCYSEKDWSDDAMEWLLTSKQNRNVTSVFCLQTIAGIPPQYRYEFEYVFEFGDQNARPPRFATLVPALQQVYEKRKLFQGDYKCIVTQCATVSPKEPGYFVPDKAYYYQARV